MESRFQEVHTVDLSERQKNSQWAMPYTPGIRVLSGKPFYISGVNAAPIYHSHPHNPKEFDALDFSPENQAILTVNNLKSVLDAGGGRITDVVQMTAHIVDCPKNGDVIMTAISKCFDGHCPTSTVAGVSELITDPRLLVEITAVAYF